MNNPKLYEKKAENYHMYTHSALQKYFPILPSGSKKRALLDIGCGPGNVTCSVLYPLIQNDFYEIVGVDVSEEMIEYACKTYGNHLLKFLHHNVAKNVPDDFFQRFDNIVSFWTFHWIPNQRQLYSSILKMLKPSGEMFAIFIANSRLYDVYSEVWNRDQWAPYVKYTDKRGAPFHKSETPTKELFKLLSEEGFKNIFCVLDYFRSEFSTIQEIEEFLISVTPEYNLIPKDQQKAFIQDHVNLLSSEIVSEHTKEYYIDYNLFVVRGIKLES